MTLPQEKDSNILVFEEFVRTKIPALICLFGFSGCGKTLSAIKIAQGIGGKSLFLDTETGRGRVYAEDAKGFTYAELTPPFTPERYMAAIKQAEKAGFDNLIIDSGSHEWDGLGGMLEIAENNVTAAGKKRTGLGKWSVKSRHKAFMNTMMAGRMNIIICLRAKDKYIQNGKGENAEIIMDGFVPLQERNFKYDMMIQLPMPEGGQGRYLMEREKGFKCPQPLLSAFKEGEQIDYEIGVKIREWIATGQPVDELMRQMKADAMAEAEYGVEHFRKYWKELPKETRLKLTPYVSNFESAARVADLDRELEGEDEAQTARNSAGVDLSRIIDKSTDAAQPAEPFKKDQRTLEQVMADNAKPAAQRNPEDDDWWTVIDEIEPKVHASKTTADLQKVIDDYAQSITGIAMASDAIVNHWRKLMVATQKRLNQKAA